jgi:hypothetical protein
MKVDMSPRAVTVRLKRVSQLRRLCLSLGKAQPIEPASDTSAKTTSTLKENTPNSSAK